MPSGSKRFVEEVDDELRKGESIPKASEDEVLEDTVRLFREGRRARADDPLEPKPAAE
jgi:hypothetical protein